MWKGPIFQQNIYDRGTILPKKVGWTLGQKNEGGSPCEEKMGAPFPLYALISPLFTINLPFFSLDERDSEKRRTTTRGLIHEVFNVKGL